VDAIVEIMQGIKLREALSKLKAAIWDIPNSSPVLSRRLEDFIDNFLSVQVSQSLH